MQTVRNESAKALTLTDRKELILNGVKEVLSFDETEAVILTENGELTVEGTGIRISELDTESGTAHVTGRIDALLYSADPSEKKKGLRSRLFGA